MLASCPVGSFNHNPRLMGILDSTFSQNALVPQMVEVSVGQMYLLNSAQIGLSGSRKMVEVSIGYRYLVNSAQIGLSGSRSAGILKGRRARR